MYSKVNTCTLEGLKGVIVEVESDLSRGLPVFNIVGLADTSIKESKERVRAAIKNSGYDFPLSRITINLAPANIRKDGSQMDLAIAVGILKSAGIINENKLENIVFIGELSLDGSINPVQGALPMVLSLRELKVDKCILPYDNREESCIAGDIDIIPVRNLKEVVDYLNKEIILNPYREDLFDNKDQIYDDGLDFSEIKGQAGLKRALEISAAGSHNMLIIGPPGSGKTMAARRLPSIMPTLSLEEAVEVTKIYSISGLLKSKSLIKIRPFRSPHHTSSAIALIGGGRMPKPGEVSLAHYGVLFLDELPEFSRNVLEVLRQPLEDKMVTISRANASLTFPAKFMLIASMNPCPCGYFGDPLHECSCTQSNIDRYLNKISSPLLDRIDIHFEVSPLKYLELNSSVKEERSESIRERVEKARGIQTDRFKDSGIFTNSEITNRDINKFCKLTESTGKIMQYAFNKYKFSGRTYNRILKVSRTIADLDGKNMIEDNHILEAISYRSLEKKYWR